MIDRKNVINELVEHIESALAVDSDYVDCVRTDLLQYTVALLKEQEPVKPIPKKPSKHMKSCSEMYDACGRCGNWITDLQNYCEICGAKIDREEGEMG